MKNLPIDLPVKAVTVRMSVGARDRVKLIAASHGFSQQDVISACLLHMPEDAIVKIIEQQRCELDSMTKITQDMLRALSDMSDEERARLRDILS
jgi:hypothetical protein